MRIGKNFIRNCITGQFRQHADYYLGDNVYVVLRGKKLGHACKDSWEGVCFWEWNGEGEHAKSLRDAKKTLRAHIRSFVRDLTDKIYARGLMHSTNYWHTSAASINAAIDNELADLYPDSHCAYEDTCSVDYSDLTNDI